MAEDKARWEVLEEWLFDHEDERFTNRSIADSFETTPQEGSALIRSHLIAQRRDDSKTLYVIKRDGRTSRAVWSAGQRVIDAKALGNTLYEDVVVKIKKGYKRDLDRLSERNPRAARYCERRIEAVVDGALKVLAASIERFDDE
jgi:hypothetical protein